MSAPEPVFFHFVCTRLPDATAKEQMVAAGPSQGASVPWGSIWGTQLRTIPTFCKLHEGRFSSDVRGKFFTERVVRCWHRLLREAVDAPSLEVFKAMLDGALGSLV